MSRPHNARGPWWLCIACHDTRENAGDATLRLVDGHWLAAGGPITTPVVITIDVDLTAFRAAMRHTQLDSALIAASLAYSFARRATAHPERPFDEAANARLTDARDRYYTARDLHDHDPEDHHR